MDVGELLSFKPTPTPKRPNDEDSGDSDDESARASKMRRMANPKRDPLLQHLNSLPDEPTITDKEREDILRFVENEVTEGEILDETAVKKLVLNFEKKALKNREMRIKFPDQPEKFMDSEIDLHEALQELSAVATVPDQYPLLVELKCVNSLLELLSHDNTDISTKVVHLLQNNITRTSEFALENVSPKSSLSSQQDLISTTPRGTKRKVADPETPSQFHTPTKKRLCRRVLQLSSQVKHKNKTIKVLRDKVRYYKKRIASLKCIIKELEKKSLIMAEDADILNKIGVLNKEIVQRQYQKSITGKTVKKKYSPELRSFALTLNFYSTKAYKYVRNTFSTCLPSLRTLTKWYQTVDGRPGFTKEAFNALKAKADACKEDLIYTLVFDEMKIKSKVEYEPSTQRTFGYVDFGNQLETDCNNECTEALVLLVVPINSSFKVPIGYFLVDKTSGAQKANLVNVALELCHENKITIKALTFDGCPANLAMAKQLGCKLHKDQLKTNFKHPVTGSNVFIYLDPVHMLKLVRNTFEKYRLLEDENGNSIRWDYLSFLQELQEKENFHLANKLRAEHIHFKTNIMKVKLASQLFSRSVATALNFCEEELKLKEQELTDVDILNESEEGAEELITALAEAECPALLLHNLARLDEQVPDERDAVHNTLGIIENITEFRPELCIEVAKQGFLQWILKRLKMKVPFDGNKLYATEILSILLQNTPENRKLLGELDGIDVLLQQLAFYKRHDPSGAEEQEAMENMFDALCCALLEPANRDRFLRGEGLQLMNLMLREKKMSRNGSLKVLDHALAGPDGRDNCNKFVDILGLRTVFPLFMKTPKRKRILTVDQHEEHVVSIISSMLRNCQGSQRQRLLAKFTENDLEKVDRLLELHFKYMDKVDRTEKEMEQEAEELDDDAQYLKRLSGGLFTLQLIDRIILEVCTAGPPTVKQRVQRVLSLRGGSLKIIRHVMREYAGNLGDAGSDDWRQQEQQHILQLVDKF